MKNINGMNEKKYYKTLRYRKRGFTLIEILTVVFLIGVICLPFSNMFIFGVKGTQNNAEHVIAYNLARGKLEEVRALPFSLIKSDYENFRDVFQDRPGFDDAYYNEDNFINYFSDIYSTENLGSSEKSTTFGKLKELYPKVYLKDLELYPDECGRFRRVVQVEEIRESAMPPKLKKITVLVFDDKERKIAELKTFVGKHK